jgi:hypothetical protein
MRRGTAVLSLAAQADQDECFIALIHRQVVARHMASSVLREIFGGPEYIGPVTGVKQEYHVFRTPKGDYAVMSKSNRSATSFHMTFVPELRVESLRTAIPKKGTTSGMLLKDKKVVDMFGVEDKQALYFEVLTTLYVLASLGAVVITKSGRNLIFTPREGS